MKFVYFFLGILNWWAFAYDLENDRDTMTWMWLLISLYFFFNSYLQYKAGKKQNGLPNFQHTPPPPPPPPPPLPSQVFNRKRV